MIENNGNSVNDLVSFFKNNDGLTSFEKLSREKNTCELKDEVIAIKRPIVSDAVNIGLKNSSAIKSVPLIKFADESKAEKVNIEIYTTYGTEKEVNIRGRVLEYRKPAEVKETDSKLKNLWNSLKYMETDEVKDVLLDVTFNGKTVKVITDAEGLFNVKMKDFGEITPGINKVTVTIAEESRAKFKADPATGNVTVQPEKDKTFGIVSDIDDTIKKSEVTSKGKLMKNTFLKNYKTSEPIPGIAQLYNILDKRNDGKIDGDLYYVSGSPINLEEKLNNFIDYHQFPEGSIDLKNLGLAPGSDKLTKQEEYKLQKIRNVFNTYPEKKFMLFGDSGEKDPEIYQKISKEFPGRVIGIYINNVTDEARNSERFKGMVLTSNTYEAAYDLYKKGYIEQQDLEQVLESTLKK